LRLWSVNTTTEPDFGAAGFANLISARSAIVTPHVLENGFSVKWDSSRGAPCVKGKRIEARAERQMRRG
jgi:hypothetical protein